MIRTTGKYKLCTMNNYCSWRFNLTVSRLFKMLNDFFHLNGKNTFTKKSKNMVNSLRKSSFAVFFLNFTVIHLRQLSGHKPLNNLDISKLTQLIFFSFRKIGINFTKLSWKSVVNPSIPNMCWEQWINALNPQLSCGSRTARPQS